MNIDYDAYTSMDQKDLAKIVSHIKNIQHLRDKSVSEAFQELNLLKLKEALEHNTEMKIYEKTLEKVDFSELEETQLDFFLFVTKLPGFDKVDRMFNKVEKGVSRALYNKKLFDFFIKEEDFSDTLKKIVKENGINSRVPNELIKEFFAHKLLEPTEECLNTVMNKGDENYLNYFIDNKIFELTEDNYRNLYVQHFKYVDEDFLVKLKTLYPDYSKITLNELLLHANISKSYTQSKDEDYDRHKVFVKIDESRFLSTLKLHKFDEENVRQLMKCFNNLAPDQNEKFKNFVVFLLESYPQYIEVVRDCEKTMTSGHFKKFYGTITNYLNLEASLERKDDLLDKKLKI